MKDVIHIYAYIYIFHTGKCILIVLGRGYFSQCLVRVYDIVS